MTIGSTVVRMAAAVMAVGLASGAYAQTPEDIRWLDQMSARRSQTVANRYVGPPPPPARAERLVQADRLWVCMGTQPGRPIYSEASVNSTAFGVTQDYIATTGSTVDGFALVMSYNGRTGFVPVDRLGPYVSDVKPGSQCIVKGFRADNMRPVFGFY